MSTLTDVMVVLDPRAEDAGESKGNGGDVGPLRGKTIGLKTASGTICQANPWPYPPGAAGAPGAEAADTPVNNEFNLQNE